MSTELDPFFAALRRDADGLPAPAPADLRRLGKRRRRRTALVAVATAFAVVGAVAIVIGAGLPHGRPRPTDPATTNPTASAVPEVPPKFQKLVPVGSGIGYGKSQPPRSGTVTTMGDRAFVSWQSESGETNVVAVDLATGRTVWGPLQLATFNDFGGVFWHPRYVFALGRHDNGTKPDGTIFTLDPETGKTLLRVDVDGFETDDIVIGESTLVIASRSDGKTRGYDLATGRVRWTVPDPPSKIVHSLLMENPAGPPAAAQRNALGGGSVATRQFVQLTADGTAIVRDLATGAESARRTGAVSTAGAPGEPPSVLAVDGILYAVDPADKRTIRATDLTRSTAATTLYTAESGIEVGLPQWCGPARICFSEQGDQSVSRFVGLDTEHKKVLWRQDGFISSSRVVDGQMLLNATLGSGDSRSAIYDAAGRQILKEQARSGTAGWIDAQSALLFDQSSTDRSVQLRGVTPLGGDPVPLGNLGETVGCGWSRTHLTCVTPTGIKVWRFAA